MNPLGVIKEHPYLAGGAALATAVIVFVVVGGHGSSPPSVTPSGGVQSDPNSAALLTAQVNAGVRNNELTAQLDAMNIQADAARHDADLKYGVQLNESNNATDVAKATLSTQQTLGLATINATQVMHLDDNATVRYQITKSAEEQITASNNSRDIVFNTNATALQINQQNANVKLASDQLASQTANHAIDASIDIAHYTADQALTATRYNADTAALINRQTEATSERIAVYQTNVLAANANTAVALGAQNANAAVAIAQANNNHGSVLGGLFSW